MKNLIYIFTMGLLIFAVVSCDKEDIKPQQDVNSETSELRRVDSEYVLNNCNDEEEKNRGNTVTKKILDTNDIITDPNRDEDEERKVKRK
ncbi:hypothetical protein [Brumimicrobium aurantiacum]|uniref:Lipoprotein n=1 Tax=Brumimicrobium aurantiacum TaxID=1737063 RepID=A0A3E1EXV6_9FLAO|nr:hypothetical protein [Brumimicrobium aurantiacum]RFC54367.1 hypothetical protein DXU93_08035 [Brumimicrobium aurantiacum]